MPHTPRIRQRPTHHLIRLLASHRIYLHYIHPLSPSLRTAELVNACEQVWHKTCLKCEKCNKQLANGGFLEKDSKWAAIELSCMTLATLPALLCACLWLLYSVLHGKRMAPFIDAGSLAEEVWARNMQC